MSIYVTVGETSGQAGSAKSRGTVTVALAKPSGKVGEESMIEISSTLRDAVCAVRLTIAEAEILQSALDSLVLEAAVPGLGVESIARHIF